MSNIPIKVEPDVSDFNSPIKVEPVDIEYSPQRAKELPKVNHGYLLYFSVVLSMGSAL